MTFRTAAPVLSIVCFAAACRSDEASNDLDVSTLVTTDVGAGWTIELPEDWSVEGTFGDPTEPEPRCLVDEVVVAHGTARTRVALVGPGCSADALARGNGSPPHFGSVDQLVDGADVSTSSTAIGSLTIATVEYFECTNECIEYNPAVGLIELDEPTDSSLPVVVISDDTGETSRIDIDFIAQHLSHS